MNHHDWWSAENTRAYKREWMRRKRAQLRAAAGLPPRETGYRTHTATEWRIDRLAGLIDEIRQRPLTNEQADRLRVMGEALRRPQ